jgi:hypothetical protein
MSVRLEGSAEMKKQELDENLPPDESWHIRETPLAATVGFLTPGQFEAQVVSWRDGWGRSGAVRPVAERILTEAVALVYYHDDAGRSDAELNIALRVEQSIQSNIIPWLLSAAEGRLSLPEIRLHGIHFTRQASITAETGCPTWTSFLEGEYPGIADQYSLSFEGTGVERGAGHSTASAK